MLFFNKKNYIFFRLRLIFYITISSIVIASDIKFNIFFKIQNYIHDSSLFLYHFNEEATQWIKSFICSLTNNQRILLENEKLQKTILIISSKLLLTEHYKQENRKLHKLLFSPIYYHKKKILAQVISNKINPYMSKIIIDKGTNHGVHIGQTAINEQGVIGQVIATNKLTSQILLICDVTHALPVQILRNHTRMILRGNGYNNCLKIKNPSDKKNIKIGDILITSGLDGRFPKGYPVAIVSSIITEKNKTTINEIQASSIAQLGHLSYLLLIENIENNIKIPKKM